MRMSTPHITPIAVKERKVSQSASCKIDSIVRQLFLPMLGMPTPERTSFLAEDMEDQLLRQVAQERPGVLATEVEFVDYMVLLYRKFQRDSTASDWVSSSGADKFNDKSNERLNRNLNERLNDRLNENINDKSNASNESHKFTRNEKLIENVTPAMVVECHNAEFDAECYENHELDSSDDLKSLDTVNFESDHDIMSISSETLNHKSEPDADLTTLGSVECTKTMICESQSSTSDIIQDDLICSGIERC